MRMGLLTRLVGVLGAIVGVLLVLGPALASGSSFIVQSFWLVMTSLLLFQRWPQGQPPAWTSGEARPWPSQQEIAEQRARARTTTRPVEPRTSAVGADAANPPQPSRTAARKKRKRRR